MKVVRLQPNGELFTAEQVPSVGAPRFGQCDQCKMALVRIEYHSGQKVRGCQGCGLMVEERADGVLVVQSQGIHRRDGCLMSGAETANVLATRECAKCGKRFNDYYGEA